jgi:hypothetical protein
MVKHSGINSEVPLSPTNKLPFEPLCTSSAKKSGQTADLEKYAGHLGRKYGST